MKVSDLLLSHPPHPLSRMPFTLVFSKFSSYCCFSLNTFPLLSYMHSHTGACWVMSSHSFLYDLTYLHVHAYTQRKKQGCTCIQLAAWCFSFMVVSLGHNSNYIVSFGNMMHHNLYNFPTLKSAHIFSLQGTPHRLMLTILTYLSSPSTAPIPTIK